MIMRVKTTVKAGAHLSGSGARWTVKTGVKAGLVVIA
jgi:hypothetical protein